MANRTDSDSKSVGNPSQKPSENSRRSAFVDVNKQPFHIRHQIENPEDLEQLVMDKIVSMGYKPEDVGPQIESMIQQRVMLNRAIENLYTRTQSNSWTPMQEQFLKDLLDVVRAVNNA